VRQEIIHVFVQACGNITACGYIWKEITETYRGVVKFNLPAVNTKTNFRVK
jgi:hypothetical protein